jgi:amino acid adenylation domain-containing protein
MERIKSVGGIIARSARLFGKRTAYIHDGATLTFIQLARDADRLWHQLRSLGIEKGEPVVVVLDKSLNFIRALAGVLQAGAIYVPVDARNPDDRIQYILRDSAAKYVIATSARIERLSALADPEVRFISIDRSEEVPQAGTARSQRQHSVVGSDVAYIIYTSGTTQMPKGVAIRHDSLLNYIQETVKMYGFSERTRILSVKSFSYDASLTDIFCPLYAGGRVYLIDETLIFPQIIEEQIRRNGITHLSCTLPVFKLLAQKGTFRPGVYTTMKTMSVGGDVVPPEVFHKIKSSIPRVRLFNRYGPTETTVACCTYEVTRQTDQNNPIPIGKPHKNVCFRAINEQGKEIGVNETGELFIGGVQVMECYWRAPELTAAVISKFDDGKRCYKTSDLVTLDANGDYVFLRRLDNIVKKHGYRISLEEVEAAIIRGGIADECVCVFILEDIKRDFSRPKIVAYLRTDGPGKPDQETREKLHLLLPNFMVPDILIPIDRIPKELSGKPARQALKRKFLDGIQTFGHAH